MNRIHPSDYDLQQFTFDQSACNPEIVEHIHTCVTCTTKVKNYQLLSNAIKALPEPIIELELSEKIMEQASLKQKQKTKPEYFLLSTLLMSLGFTVVLVVYFRILLIDFFYTTASSLNFFLISTALLITILLIIDTQRTFKKKLSKINNQDFLQHFS